ncbi:mitogen-activated protein kinase kinase kinase 20-like [Diospyros lotus]|uniref:mitogen-activated protein kinase kinase kinase 20-like n=1 Tax=Diospyros lotus TaxID=55363 RepID=UPI00224FFB57|nr:mitogen-activated protein kinase kinase kinase 20-like [Diospyros lotus]
MVFWVKKQVLGQGTYGTVSLAVIPFPHLHRPEIAVKTARRASYISSLHKEVQILEALRFFPGIVRCFDGDLGVEEQDGKKKITYHLLLEFAPGGSLKDLIPKNGGTLPDSDVMRYTHMILEALRYVHGEGYVHCDIKPSNIIVFPSREMETETNVRPQDHYLKIADFGSAKRRDSLLSRGCRGTLLYSSPESVLCGLHESPADIEGIYRNRVTRSHKKLRKIRERLGNTSVPLSSHGRTRCEKQGSPKYSPTPTDIWSLGCTMIEMITGKPPWSTTIKDVRQLQREIGMGKQLPAQIPQNLSEHGKDFLRMCLIRDPCSRWTADMLLEHPFLAEGPLSAAVAYYPSDEDNRWNSVQSMFERYHYTVKLGMMKLKSEAQCVGLEG